MHIHNILETSLYIPDLNAAQHFYQHILGLTLIVHEPQRYLFLRCGSGVVLIFTPETANTPRTINDAPIPPHGATGPMHVAFAIVEADISAWRTHLEMHDVAIESEVTWPHGATSIYMRDPGNNSVELATPSLWGLAET